MRKRIISLVTAAALLAAVICINIAAAASGASVKLTADENVEDRVIVVRGELSGNPGIAGFKFTLNYDAEAFSVDKDATALGDDFKGGNTNIKNPGKVIFVWADSKDYTGNGELFEAYFYCNDGWPNGYGFTLTYNENDVANTKLENVAVNITNIEVQGSETEEPTEEPTETPAASPEATAEPNATPVPAPTPDPLAINVTNPFNDVPSGEWYYDYVMYCYAHKLVNGMTAVTYEPQTPMTRAMFVTILYRMAGNGAKTANNPFTDVGENEWYADAVKWSAAENILPPTYKVAFEPNTMITREEMMVILYNYYKGEKVNYNLNFSDAALISEWAKDAVRYCVSKGIILGRGDNVLAPKEGLTRAEASKMFFIVATTLSQTASGDAQAQSDGNKE